MDSHETFRVRVVNVVGDVLARIEGPHPDVQQQLDDRAWKDRVGVEAEVFVQLDLGDGDWVTIETVDLTVI